MKKLLLISALLFSGGAWADDSCENKPHAPVPPKNLSLYDEKTDDLKDYTVVRQKLIKDGWTPIPSEDKYADHPEEEELPGKGFVKKGEEAKVGQGHEKGEAHESDLLGGHIPQESREKIGGDGEQYPGNEGDGH